MSLNERSVNLLILYGSETGNSEDMAKLIARQAIDRSISVRVFECDEYEISKLVDEKLILIVCSTTGVGEEPNNMKSFWRFIRRRDLPKDSLSSVYISVVGLGDSSYQKYNFVAKKLYKRLIDLGAKSLTDLVLGDDQHDFGPNGAIDPWLNHFWSQVNRVFSIEYKTPLIEESDRLFSASYNVRFIDINRHKNEIKSEELVEKRNQFHKHNPYLANVLFNERITSENHFQDVRLIKLELDDKKLSYGLGDICCIRPENSVQNVDKFLSLLNLDPNMYFVVERGEHNWMSRSSYYNNLPNPCSVRTLITQYMDIQSIPKRSFFDLFYRFSKTDLEKEKLKGFAKDYSSEDLYEYCNRPKRGILEVMTDFPDTTPYIEFQYLFDLIPAINPRSFSIASSLNVFPNELHLLVAVVNYTTRLKEPRLGLCSNWLSNQLPDNKCKIPLFIRKGTFKIADDSQPIITIGPGTGVAPFRAFIEDRSHRQVSNNYLFFGCRNRNSDFYLEEEWNRVKDLGFLRYFVAFSRDFDKKIYVQNKVWEQKELVFHLINDMNAIVYIAGNAKQMPQQIKQTICDVFKDQTYRELDNEKVEKMVDNMELRGRIQYECWS